MRPNELLMYIADNKIIIWTEKKVISEEFKNSILQGKICRINEFVKKMEAIIKKYKLNNKILNNNITVITDPSYSAVDNEVVKYCLEKTIFNKITINNILKLCELKKNNIWILANKTYMYLILYDYKGKIKNIFIDYHLFGNNISTLARHLSTIIKKHKVIILGLYSEIEKLALTIEMFTNTKTYYIEDTKLYITKKLEIHYEK